MEPDYILVSHTGLNKEDGNIRNDFENELKKKGLIVNRVLTDDLIYTTITITDKVKYRYFDILELRMPLKNQCEKNSAEAHPQNKKKPKIEKLAILFGTGLRNYYLREDDDLKEIMKQPYFQIFKKKLKTLFDLENEYFKKKIWNILIINFILSRQGWKSQLCNCCDNSKGIDALINKGIYIAAYPPHDGTWDDHGTKRRELHDLWNDTLYWWKKMPLDDMQEYSGNPCALYFSWLEFYTRMLFPVSVFGLLLILLGLVTLPIDKYSDDVCKAKNITMCPECDYTCEYYPLSDNCVYTMVIHLFDNNFTIVCSTVMALWASLLSGLWKRRMKVLQRKWNLIDSVDEKARQQYFEDLQKYREKTGLNLKNIPLIRRLLAYFCSSSILLLFVILVAIANLVIILFESWITSVVRSTNNDAILSNEYFIFTITSGILNLITIKVLNKVYSKVAVILNDREYHRTKSEYDRAIIIKNVIFQFINTYTPILYIALVKGKFSGFPGHYNTIFGYRQIECNKRGCLMELQIKLLTIMVGQQLTESFSKFKSVFERVLSKCLFPKKKIKENYQSLENDETSDLNEQSESKMNNDSHRQWRHDYILLDFDEEGGLCNEYLELTIQYGFVMLFTPIFPLVPLFAWIRNIFEIRLDSKKIISFYRRFVPYLNPNMIIWLQIFDVLANISVPINAFIIAFSTNVIPRFVYSWLNNGNDEGFLNASLSSYSTSDLNESTIPKSSSNISVCYYSDFREPYWSPNKYDPTFLYWHILVAKFVFIVLYQNVIFILKSMLLSWIPEMPQRLHNFQKRERDCILSCLEEKNNKEKKSVKKKTESSDHNETEKRCLDDSERQNQLDIVLVDVGPSDDLKSVSKV